MKPNLENLKEYAHKTSLTQEEKLAMFQNIREYSNTHPIKTTYYSIFFKHSIAYASMFALIIGTSATSFASEYALPGDILYPVKTEVNEKIAKTFAFTDTQKAKVNVKLVDKRMEELTKIVATDQDTPEKVDVIVAQLEEHKEEIKEYIKEVQTTDTQEVEDAIAIATELESIVGTHIDILEEVSDEIASTNTEEVPPKETTSTMILIEEVPNTNEISTTTKDIPEPQDAISEILDFSAELEPIFIEAKTKNNKDTTDENRTTSTKIKEDTRKRIIEKAEEELHIIIEENKN